MSGAQVRRTVPTPLGHRLIVVATSCLPPGAESEIALGKHHRIDYLELAKLHNSPCFDYSGLSQNPWRRIEERMKLDFGLAYAVRQAACQADARVILCFSERVGIPLGLLRPRAKIVVIAHNPFSRVKYPLIARLVNRWDSIVLFSQAEANEFIRRMPCATSRVHVIPPAIDTHFYRPGTTPGSTGTFAYSIGRTHRDYQTLIRAFEQLPETLACRVCTSSLWNKGATNLERQVLPSNVSRRYCVDPVSIREEISQSRFLIAPIRPTNNGWNDGCTSVTLAGAMGRPIIATAIPALSELVAEGETGLLVPPGDPQALAGAVSDLWQHPEAANEMGRRARLRAESVFSYTVWLARLSEILCQLAD
jgi:glycosyltransferase involved in cell wall biosynthesis